MAKKNPLQILTEGGDPTPEAYEPEISFEQPTGIEQLDPLDVGAFTQYLALKMQGVTPSRRLLVEGPELLATTNAYTEEQLLLQAINEGDQFLGQTYGDSDISAYLMASRYTDPQQRAEAFDYLRGISGGETPLVTRQVSSGKAGFPITQYQDPVTGEWSTEKPEAGLGEVPEFGGINQLTHRSAAMTAFLMTRVDDVDEDGNVVSSYDYDKVLTPAQLKMLKEGVIHARSAGSTGVLGDEYRSPILRVQHESNTYELSEEWLRAHPVRGMAAIKFLEENHPDAEIRIGGQGLLHPALDAISKPIDWVSGPVALSYKYGARIIGEISETAQLGTDRSEYQKTYDRMQADLANGLVPPEEVPDYLRDMSRMQDWATAGNIHNPGESFSDDLHQVFRPDNAGEGLAVSSADGIGLLPGDPLYQPWVTGVMLIHNFGPLDPIGWAGNIRQGAKLAETVATGSISGVTRANATRSGLQAAVESGGTATRYLSDTQWVRIGVGTSDDSAVTMARLRNLEERARTAAQARGYDVLNVTNADGTHEVMILGMSSEEGLALARGMGQESFRTADGIIHTDRTITPVDWGRADDVTDVHALDTDVLHGDTAVAFRMDVPDEAVRLKPAPPKVSQNWMIQQAYQVFAKTPDEMMHTDVAVRTSGRIYDEVAAARKLGEEEYFAATKAEEATVDGARRAGADKALSVLASWGRGFDPYTLRALADARDGGDVHNILVASISGGIKDPLYLEKLMTRQADISARLGEIGNELNQMNRMESELAAAAERAGITDLGSKNLTRLRDFTNGGQGGGLRDLVDRWQKARAKLAALDAERIDLLGERYSIQSQLDLDEVTMPIRQLPPEKMIEQLNAVREASRRDPVEEMLKALSREALKHSDASGKRVSELMQDLERTLTARGVKPSQVKRVMKQARRGADGEARKSFRIWRHINDQMTGGLTIHMPVPGHGVPAKELSDYTRRTIDAIRARTKLFGLSQADTEEILTAYLRIQNREDWYRFVKKFYEDIADKSPYLDARSRMEMRQTHQDLLSERGGGYINTQGADGVVTREDTLSRTIIDPVTGQKVKSAVPAYSGDWLDVIHLPSNELDMQHLSRVRRWTTRAAQAGGAQGVAAEALMGVRDVINASTYIWKSAVLIGRMPFALLSRIQGEQALRMAALDYASGVNHPLDWWRSVKAEGELSRFADSHAEFLGTLVDNYNDAHSFGRSVRVWRRGRTALSPVDGERYWNALSAVFLRRFNSPEVAFYLDHNPREILDWLRGVNSGELGDGIIDNIMSTRGLDDALDGDEFLLDRLGRMKQELDDLVGESPELRATLKRGSTPIKKELPGDYYASGVESYQLGDETRTVMRIDGQQGEYARLVPGENGDWYVDYIEVPENLRGQGLGKKLYARAQAEAQAQGGRLTSGLTLKPEARRVWERLVAEGKARQVPIRAKQYYGEYQYIADEFDELATRVEGSTAHSVGTTEFASYLRELHEAGEFMPPQFVNAKASEYVMGDKANLGARFRDWAFEHFYSNPDVKYSRGPMFRQAAAREFDRLRTLGWTERRAEQAAVAYAASRVSEWMYDLAARTAGQYWLRNIMPFFPAYQELGGVWLKRLPMARGGGGAVGWAAGSAYFARRAKVLVDFLEDTGIVTSTPDGGYEVAIPGLDQAIGFLTGEEGVRVRFNADSLTGMFPFPKIKDGELDLGTLIPGLGPMPSMVFGKMAQHNDTIDQLSNVLLPYGDNPRLGPTSINNLFYATGHVPPWEYMTRDTQQLYIDWSIEDALRSVVMDVGPPDPNWSAARKRAWSEDVVSRAEKRSGAYFLLRAVVSMTSPASVSITSEYEQEMDGIWRFVEAYREGTGESAASPLIEGFKATYPGAVWYTNGRSITHGERRGDSFDSFIHDWQDGKVRTFTPQEQVEWNLGMTQYWNTVGRTSQTSRGKTAAQLLTSGFERQQVTGDAWSQFQTYLDANPKFNEMFQDWQAARDEQDKVSTSALSDHLLSIKRDLQSLDSMFTVNGVRDGDYRKIIGVISSNIEYVARHTDDPAWKGVNWWYKNVGNEANEAIGALYDEAFNLPKPERGPIFEQIRQLKNSWTAVQYKGQTMPTPEEVTWGNLSPQEQAIRRIEWSTSPVEWLSNFELRQAGYGGDPLWNEMSTMIARDKAQLDQVAAENYWSTSSTEYQQLKERMVLSQASWAKENGMFEEYVLSQGSPYQRMIYTGAHQGNKTFEGVALKVQQLTAVVNAQGYEIGGSSEIARRAQALLFQTIDEARIADPAFGKLMDQAEVAFAPSGRDKAPGYEMYFQLWLNYFGPTPYVP